MAEQTKGGGFRERIYFDEELWHDLEECAAHMRLKPAELVKYLTAMGLAQMRGLTMMEAMRRALEPHIEDHLTADAERLMGIPASQSISNTSPEPVSNGSDRKARR